jgi:hypothetical protein
MSKNLIVNTDYVKDTVIVEITKVLDKLNASYKILSTMKIPSTFALKSNLAKDREKMFLAINELTRIKNELLTICNNYDLESNLTITNILAINHF